MLPFWGMDFITVSRAPNPAEAELARSFLEANGFVVNLTSEVTAIDFGYGLPVGGVQIQVPEDQAESARTLLQTQDPPSS
jgi:hypothetical protein